MSISQVSSSTSSTPEVVGFGDNSTMDKTAFLKLLTVQLANQDPLNPMDSSGMAEQQAVFAQVEQLINLNDNMETFMNAQNSVFTGIADMFSTIESSNFLGRDVSVLTDSVEVNEDGTKTGLYYDLPYQALVGYTVTDSVGTVVKTVPQVSTASGTNKEIAWDGTDSDGNPVAEGTYHITLNGQDTSGQKLGILTYGPRTVQGVDFRNGAPQLTLDDGSIVDTTDIITLSTHEESE